MSYTSEYANNELSKSAGDKIGKVASRSVAKKKAVEGAKKGAKRAKHVVSRQRSVKPSVHNKTAGERLDAVVEGSLKPYAKAVKSRAKKIGKGVNKVATYNERGRR
jgi:hypothetical protein